MGVDGKRVADAWLPKVGGLHMSIALIEKWKSAHENAPVGEARSRLG